MNLSMPTLLTISSILTSSLFTVMILAVPFGVVNAIIEHIDRKAGVETKPSLFNKIVRTLFIATGILVLCSVAMGSCITNKRKDLFTEICKQPVDRILVSFGSENVEFSDNVAREFRSLLQSGRNVLAHHSNPIDEIQIHFEGARNISYSLGKDCDVPNEYWLKDITSPGCESVGCKVRQFQSTELTKFLEIHGPQVSLQEQP
ncbi:MAG: hypothetical protein KDA54_08740 [Phycisphaerales bacterium]|nr:hypothetical protein [Phycisphaerales bacterium]